MTREERKRLHWKKNHKIVDGQIYRLCSKCKVWFPETTEYFYMHNKSKPEKGFISECIICSRTRSRKYQEEHIEHALKNILEWQKENNRDRYNKIRKWLQEDYKLYIVENKPPKRVYKKKIS